jgi:hypothetical protein
MSTEKNHMEAVYYLLSRDSAVTALVGSKIFPVAEPQQDGYPAIIYSQLDDDEILTKDGPQVNGQRFSLEIYGETYSSVQNVAKAARALLRWYTGEISGTTYRISYQDQQDMRQEEETENFGVVQDYSLRIINQ